MTKTVWCQVWEESERGWGCRPDGFSLHATREDVDKYIKEYWTGMPKEVPDEYSRPCGEPYEIQITAADYKKTFKNKVNGVRIFGWGSPKRGETYSLEEAKK